MTCPRDRLRSLVCWSALCWSGFALADELPLEVKRLSDGDIALFWPSVPDGVYRIEISDNLEEWALWRHVLTGEFGSPSSVNMGSTEFANRTFWRVHAFEPPPGALLYDSLEAGPSGWRNQVLAGGTRWDLARPEDYGPTSAPSGFHVWGTGISSPYFSGEIIVIDSPLLDLTGITGAELSFWHWIDMEEGFDFGLVDIVNDLGIVLAPAIGAFTGIDMNWRKVTLPLPAGVMGQQVRVRYRFQSDSLQEEPQAGWYLDEICVKEVP